MFFLLLLYLYVCISQASVFALVTTTAMQIEALMLLGEPVLAKHTVPASELWQALHVTWGAA